MVNKKEVNHNFFAALADDSLSLLRINFVLVGLYLTAFGLFSQAIGGEFVTDILNATYTQFALHALFASMAGSVLIYRRARRISAQRQVIENERYSEEMQVTNMVTAAAFASFGSVVCLTIGIIEAFAGEAPPFSFPLFAVGLFIVIWILGPFSFLTIIDKLSERSSHVRNIVQMFI